MNNLQDKPSVLVISPVMPHASGKGINQRISNHILSLVGNYKVSLIVFFRNSADLDNDMDPETEGACADICKINVANMSSSKDTDGFGWLLKSLFSAPGAAPVFGPEQALKFRDPIERIDPDLVFFFRISSARLMDEASLKPLLAHRKIWIDFDDIESKWVRRNVQTNKKKLGKLYSFLGMLNAFKLDRIEKRLANKADALFICSQDDRRELLQSGKGRQVVALPNIVNLPNALEVKTDNNPRNILFVGTMSYEPNIDAARYFCEEIWPLLQAAVPTPTELYIVGYGAGEAVKKFAAPEEIYVTGGVDSVLPFYEQADIVITPIRYGGGTRIKILEAMAYGRPIVSTTIGAEGIEIEDGENILIADTPEDFCRHCCELLQNSDLAAKLIRNGKTLVDEKYSLKNNRRIFAELLDKG